MTNQIGHVMDFMTTFILLANTRYPATYNGHTIKPTQGISLLPILKDEQRAGHEALFNEHYGARYARYEGWKLVARNKEPWHLYHIEDDETEMNNLADQYPEKVHQLDSMWNDWEMRNNVLPKRSTK